MARISPIKPDFSSSLPAATYLHRAASAHLRSFVTGGMTPVDVARSTCGNDGATALMLKAASSPATTATTGWAKDLAGVSVFDLVASASSLSAGADLITELYICIWTALP